MKAQKGSKGIAYSFFNLGARLRWMVNAAPQPLYSRQEDPIPNIQKIG
jgi:hypothetical protein